MSLSDIYKIDDKEASKEFIEALTYPNVDKISFKMFEFLVQNISCGVITVSNKIGYNKNTLEELALRRGIDLVPFDWFVNMMIEKELHAE